MRGYLTIGVKPNCANLIIGEFSSDYNPANPDANILLRLPLLWSVRRGHSVDRKEPTKNPNEPNNPTSTPGGTVSGNGTGSVPGGEISTINYTG